MEILVDGTQIPGDGVGTLGEAMEAARRAVAGDDRLIVEVTLDGEDFSPDDQKTRADESADGRLEIVTAAPSELQGQVVDTLDALLEETAARCTTAGEHLQSGRRDEGLREIVQVVNDMSAAIEAVSQLLGLADRDPRQVAVGESDLFSLMDRLARTLVETQKAVTSGDPVALPDVVEHELAPQVDEWREAVGVLRDL